MRDKFWLKVFAISVALVMVLSCVTPCITVDNNSTGNRLKIYKTKRHVSKREMKNGK